MGAPDQPVWDGRVRPLTGGVDLPADKARTRNLAIEQAALPTRLVLPLRQHLGAEARPTVVQGQRVLGGAVIAVARGEGSLALHAPTSGRVEAIAEHPAPHPSGETSIAIVLVPDGADAWTALAPMPDWRERPRAALLGAIEAAGIAGLGGAGYPTAAKAASAAQRPMDFLILNGTECEPCITADDRLMRERGAGILDGLAILAHLVRAGCCLIAIEDDKPEAIEAIAQALVARPHDNQTSRPAVHVVTIPSRYPSGSERQLIEMLTGREVPSGGTPADVGVICQNVATAWAVHRAISKGAPLTSRVTTVTGGAVTRPGNLEIRLGTPVSEILAARGLETEALGRLILGGPMSGFELPSADAPVIKTTQCILAATAHELPREHPEQPCIRCGACFEVCPARLLPQQLFWHVRAGSPRAAQNEGLLDCIECGACAYVCPSRIPLVQYYRAAKGELRREDAEAERALRARERFETRLARVADAERARDAAREARRTAAADAVARARARARARADDSSGPPS